MPFTVTFTATAYVGGSLRTSGNTLLVDDQTARMLVDLGVATATGLTAQTGAVAANLASTVLPNTFTTGKKQTVSHDATLAGLNVAPVAGDPSTLSNGDVWHNSTANELRARVNGRSFPLNGLKAWVNFNGTGTIAIRAAYNISSITDNGVGDYTLNFTNALADVNYGCAGFAADAIYTAPITVCSFGTYTQTTSAFRIKTSYAGTLYDNTHTHVVIFR